MSTIPSAINVMPPICFPARSNRSSLRVKQAGLDGLEVNDMAQSIKLGDDIMKIIRRESELQSRSLAGQIAHWVRIGRTIEKSGNFDHARISAALAGDIETTELTGEEKDVWLDSFIEKMGQPGSDEEAFFARRRQLGLGVGLDAAGNLVREDAHSDA